MRRLTNYQVIRTKKGDGYTNVSVRRRGVVGGAYKDPPGTGWKIIGWVALVSFTIMWPWMLHTDLTVETVLAILWYAFVINVIAFIARRR